MCSAMSNMAETMAKMATEVYLLCTGADERIMSGNYRNILSGNIISSALFMLPMDTGHLFLNYFPINSLLRYSKLMK